MTPRPNSAAATEATTASQVVQWWSAAQRDWFSHAPDFDRRFRARFLRAHHRAAAGELNHWSSTAEGALALLVLLDQFPRNAFRGTAHMYATDFLARNVARAAVNAGLDAQVDPALRLFFYLPFAHSEDPADQRLSVMLNRRLGQPWLDHALGHQAIVERFGRFPHRNILLGRSTTAAEQAFLDQGGFAG
ncbi:DUF924 family protein [Pseudomonas aeruginosa]|uniref:DUF924 family protein n=1 Tax=Pseudomonas TaxID=286 RepID=UPI0004F2FA88|nr:MULTISPECIES: DUF924 family protein [Pseudomonas]ALY86965.1 hypothetical protein HV95_29255 [Pseudomonas aeruginosa]AVZ17517.1 DUF924 family protein [Pseudomonas aeruginosa]EIU2641261.1 DUF924 family protein [Pseudomonas aeruginosa]EIU4983884.1 DUF924 family protein [Pseudomonas aeruginosa]EIU9543372.1 DUF924 family protein [Pseudomonas aeruginosa]